MLLTLRGLGVLIDSSPFASTRHRENMMAKEPLRFKVAPHIVEDLGLNLYTNLPRVLVEFVANAYDADSPHARILLDKDAVDKARTVMRKEYELEKAKMDGTDGPLEPLASRTLPEPCRIVIEDEGCGMSREDLDTKFLVAGRRRRKEEPEANDRSAEGRLLMGRKGLGKLAGFGVAKRIEVITRKKGQTHATRIVMEYDEIVKHRSTHQIVIPDDELPDGGGFEQSGTRVILSQLLYDPMKSRSQTIGNVIAEHFQFIDPNDFAIELNGKQVQPLQLQHAYAWPEPERPTEEFVEKTILCEDGGSRTFAYRLRFTEEGAALPAARRGIRVYSHDRLASSSSLLIADTNMHGFRMTDYLDGVVHADFIDEEEADYISTDRQSLRWESPLLSNLHEFLSDEIKTACAKYQKLRDDVAPGIVKDDPFTATEIEKCEFSKRDRRMALRLGVILKDSCKQGVKDPAYKEKLPIFLRSIGHGNILSAISQLADQPLPDINKLAVEIARLTADEFDQFISYAKIRLKAISGFRKIVAAVDFKDKENEHIIQETFEKSPWMIDPTYTQFLTADDAFDILFARLAKDLGIGKHASEDASKNEKRPDLVFLLGSKSLDRLVIVELKSANLPLQSKHLDQLMGYMRISKQWLVDNGRPNVTIEGHLIGSFASSSSRVEGVLALRQRIDEAGPGSPWAVRTYGEILSDTEAAHRELLDIHERVETAAQKQDESND